MSARIMGRHEAAHAIVFGALAAALDQAYSHQLTPVEVHEITERACCDAEDDIRRHTEAGVA